MSEEGRYIEGMIGLSSGGAVTLAEASYQYTQTRTDLEEMQPRQAAGTAFGDGMLLGMHILMSVMRDASQEEREAMLSQPDAVGSLLETLTFHIGCFKKIAPEDLQ